MRILRRTSGWFIALLGFAFLSAGCGSGDELPREAISGTVEFEGQPLANGQIQFFPTADGGATIACGATITNGSFSISRAEGPVPGTYKVMISSEGEIQKDGKKFQGEEVGDMPGLGPLNAPELIPPKYNATTELTAEVKKGGPNEFPFKLTK